MRKFILLNRYWFGCKWVTLLMLPLCSLHGLIGQQTMELLPVQDNSLYEDTGGNLSNGSGQHIFAGRNGKSFNSRRRALLLFQPARVLPSDAVIDSVWLRLYATQAPDTVERRIQIRALLNSWGEGSSDAAANEGGGVQATAGDATWKHRFYDTLSWEQAGGDFADAVLASQMVKGKERYYHWSDTALTASVQAWLQDSTQNFGWILLGEEQTTRTARRFASREHPDSALRPHLFIRYHRATPIAEHPGEHVVRVFPNPTSGRLILEWNRPVTAFFQLKLYDATGRLLQSWQNRSSSRVPLQLDYPTGMYFLHIQYAGSHRVEKIVLVQ